MLVVIIIHHYEYGDHGILVMYYDLLLWMRITVMIYAYG